MEPEGITRACTMVPVIRKNASATHSHESNSRPMRRPSVDVSGAPAVKPARLGGSLARVAVSGGSGFMTAGLLFSAFGALDRGGGSGHGYFDLHIFGKILAGVARGAKAAGGVADGLAQAFKRKVTDRVSVEKRANLLERAGGAVELAAAAIFRVEVFAAAVFVVAFGDLHEPRTDSRSVGGQKFFARGRVDAVIAGRDGCRATDAHVNFRGAGFAHQADDFAAGGAANDGVIHKDDALALEQRADGVELEPDAEIANRLLRLD